MDSTFGSMTIWFCARVEYKNFFAYCNQTLNQEFFPIINIFQLGPFHDGFPQLLSDKDPHDLTLNIYILLEQTYQPIS